MRSAFAVVILPLLLSAAKADHVDRVIVVEAGLYNVRIVPRSELPHDFTVAHIVRTATLRQRTTIVPGRVGIWFGVRYRLDGSPNGVAVPLRLVTSFPSPGIRYPGTSRVHSHTESTVHRHVGAVAYRGFHFDHTAEIVPGLWVFEFWWGSRKVGDQRFCVIEAPSSAASGGGQAHDCAETPLS